MRSYIKLLITAFGAVLTGCSGSGADTYTLYRTSTMSEERVHWATFDARSANPAYNLENCALAMDVLNKNVRAQNGGEAPVRFWCEAGSFRA